MKLEHLKIVRTMRA